MRAVAVRDELPGPDVWVGFRRSLGEPPELKTSLSNAPANIPRRELVRVSGMRWPIETCFEGAKGELGMAEYQTPSWRGWHNHMTLVILAHHFVVGLKLKHKQRAPALTVPQACLLLRAALPWRELTASQAIELVPQIQARNHKAEASHYKHHARRRDKP